MSDCSDYEPARLAMFYGPPSYQSRGHTTESIAIMGYVLSALGIFFGILTVFIIFTRLHREEREYEDRAHGTNSHNVGKVLNAGTSKHVAEITPEHEQLAAATTTNGPVTKPEATHQIDPSYPFPVTENQSYYLYPPYPSQPEP